VVEIAYLAGRPPDFLIKVATCQIHELEILLVDEIRMRRIIRLPRDYDTAFRGERPDAFRVERAPDSLLVKEDIGPAAGKGIEFLQLRYIHQVYTDLENRWIVLVLRG
jgi:hypothetical protein